MSDLITVHWDTLRKTLHADRVTVTAPPEAPDRELAIAAGYGPRHWGFNVTRHDDGSATVALHND